MAVTPTGVLLQTPKITPQNFVQGTDSAGTYKTIFTAGANGSKVVAITLSTTDTAATHIVTVVLTRSATLYILGSYVIPINSGSNGVAANVNLLAGGPSSLIVGLPVDLAGQSYLFMENGDTLQATFATALTSSTRIDILTVGANF